MTRSICLTRVGRGGTRAADEVLQWPTTDMDMLLAGKLSKPAQVSSSLCRTDWRGLPGTMRAQRRPACTGLPAVPTASSRDLCTKPRAVVLERTPVAGSWTQSSTANDHHQEKKLLFVSRLTLSGLSPGTERCLLPGPSDPGQSSVCHHTSPYTQAFADGDRSSSWALSR